MSESLNKASGVSVSVTVGDVKVQFSGTAESVMTSVITFLAKQIPTMDLAYRISLNYAVTDLIESFSHIIKITPEGPRVIPTIENDALQKKLILSDKEMVGLQLVANKIAKELGKIPDDLVQLSEIQAATALNHKSISSRLSELVKAGYVSRDETESVGYRITTTGIHWLSNTISKKIKT